MMLRLTMVFLLLGFTLYAQNIPALQYGAPGAVMTVAYSYDGKKIVTTDRYEIKVWDAGELRLLHTIHLIDYFNSPYKRVLVSIFRNELYLIDTGNFYVYSLDDYALLYTKQVARGAELDCDGSGREIMITVLRGKEYYTDVFHVTERRYEVSSTPIIKAHRKWDRGDTCVSRDKTMSVEVKYFKNNMQLFNNGSLIVELPRTNFNRYYKPCAISPANDTIAIGGKYLGLVDLNDANRSMKSPEVLNPAPIQIMGVTRGKALLQGDNLYIGWDLETGREIWRNFREKTICHDCSPNPMMVLFSHQDRAIVRSSYGGSVGLFIGGSNDGLLDINLSTGLFTGVPVCCVGSLSLSSDDRTLTVSSGDGTMRVYDTASFALKASGKGEGGQAYIGSFDWPTMFMSDDGHTVVSQGASLNSITVLNVEHNTTQYIPWSNKQPLGKLFGVTRDGRGLLTYDYDLGLNLLDTDGSGKYLTFECSKERPKYTHFSQDGKRLTTMDDAYNFKTYRLSDGKMVEALKFDANVAAITPIDETKFLLQLKNNVFRIYDIERLEKVADFISLEAGEWIIMTRDGYFNASSQKAFRHAYMRDAKGERRPLTNDELLTWYRPDRVTAALQNNAADSTMNQNSIAALPLQSGNVNRYCDLLWAGYEKSKDPDYLVAMRSICTIPGDVTTITEAIERNKNEATFFTLYSYLSPFEKSAVDAFIYKRLAGDIGSKEQWAALYALRNEEESIAAAVKLYASGRLAKSTRIMLFKWTAGKGYEQLKPWVMAALENSDPAGLFAYDEEQEAALFTYRNRDTIIATALKLHQSKRLAKNTIQRLLFRWVKPEEYVQVEPLMWAALAHRIFLSDEMIGFLKNRDNQRLVTMFKAFTEKVLAEKNALQYDAKKFIRYTYAMERDWTVEKIIKRISDTNIPFDKSYLPIKKDGVFMKPLIDRLTMESEQQAKEKILQAILKVITPGLQMDKTYVEILYSNIHCGDAMLSDRITRALEEAGYPQPKKEGD